MLSYQHTYHAGCFADVVKHLVLASLLRYMTQKEKPMFYMESHSGYGLYDLNSRYAQKTGERAFGIDLFWNIQSQLPAACKPYVEVIQALNHDKTCKTYPGSPYLAKSLLRATDRMVLCELHPEAFSALEHEFKHDRRVLCLHHEGMSQLKAMLPPKEKRGLIFIDPAFEVKTEYRTIPEALQLLFKRFSTGTYCLWYPIIDKKLHEQWVRRLIAIRAPYLCVEFKQKDAKSAGMSAFGLWIIHPPYTLRQELESMALVWRELSLHMEITDGAKHS